MGFYNSPHGAYNAPMDEDLADTIDAPPPLDEWIEAHTTSSRTGRLTAEDVASAYSEAFDAEHMPVLAARVLASLYIADVSDDGETTYRARLSI